MSSQTLSAKVRSAGRGREVVLRDAWLAYLVMLMLPFAVLAVGIARLSGNGTTPTVGHHANRWFLLTMAYLAVAFPAALFFRRHLCIAYFRGEPVAPRHYLIGMLAVWLILEVGMILSIVGCYVSVSFFPGLLPAVLAFMFFVTLWPTGKMMVSRVGASEDPQIYKPPR
jgi:hypothetical protein